MRKYKIYFAIFLSLFMVPLCAEDIKPDEWVHLIDDALGDENAPSLPSAQGLDYYYNPQTDKIAFRVRFSNFNHEKFGINLAFDIDQDQTNGMSWWGQNKAYKFDKLMTVWVELQGKKYVGTIGFSKDKDVAKKRYAKVKKKIDIEVDQENQVVILTVKRKHIDNDHRFNVIGAVGSNELWNDDLHNSGYSAIALNPDGIKVKTTEPISNEEINHSKFGIPKGAQWNLLFYDDRADSNNKKLPDGKSLYYYFHKKSRYVFFKVVLYGKLPEFTRLTSQEAQTQAKKYAPGSGFGFNLVVDTDQDQSTGEHWWGSNKDFTFDSLFTIWLGPQSFIVGMNDAASVMAKNYTQKYTKAVSIPGQQKFEDAFYFAIRLEVLDSDGSVIDGDGSFNCIAAVGSEQAWNDDLCDEGYRSLNIQWSNSLKGN